MSFLYIDITLKVHDKRIIKKLNTELKSIGKGEDHTMKYNYLKRECISLIQRLLLV